MRRRRRLLALLARPVLVVWMLLQVQDTQPLGLLDVRLSLLLAQELPLAPQPLTDLGIVHLGRLRAYLLALYLAPYHERVHGSLDVACGRRFNAATACAVVIVVGQSVAVAWRYGR